MRLESIHHWETTGRAIGCASSWKEPPGCSQRQRFELSFHRLCDHVNEPPSVLTTTVRLGRRVEYWRELGSQGLRWPKLITRSFVGNAEVQRWCLNCWGSFAALSRHKAAPTGCRCPCRIGCSPEDSRFGLVMAELWKEPQEGRECGLQRIIPSSASSSSALPKAHR